MRKFLLLVTAALLAATLILAGCGKTTTKANDATKILKDSNKAMLSVKSYKVAGSINATTNASSQGAMNVTFEMQIQKKGQKEFEGHMLMHSSGQDIEMYITNGFVYTNEPGKGWVKQTIGSVTDISRLGSPSDISKLGDAAQNAKLLTEDSQYYKIAFDLNASYLKELMGLQKSTQSLSGDEKKIADAMIKSMKMGALFKIEKSTMFVVSMVMNLNIPDMPSVGTVKEEVVIHLSEFNKPVEVNLPADAVNAPEVTGSETLTPTP